MSELHKGHSPVQAIMEWCRSLTGDRSGLASCCEEALERMAHDVGVSGSELHALASHGSQSADLLYERMAALDLDKEEVARTERATFQDLQRVCTMCTCQRRCAHDLAYDPLDPVWKNYCPNAQTLTALGTQPWATRQEW